MGHVEEILADAKDAFHIRNQWETVLENVYQLTMPDRFWGANSNRTPEKLFNRVYDSTAVKAAQRLADRLYSGLTPTWTPWFSLGPGPQVRAAERGALLDALQPVTQIVAHALNTSNFGAEAQAMYLDLTVGTGLFKVQPAPSDASSDVEFKSYTLDGVALRHDSEGVLSHVYRRFGKFGWEIASKPEWMQQVTDSETARFIKDNPGMLFECLEAVTPSADGKRTNIAGFKYKSDWALILLKTDPTHPGADQVPSANTVPGDGWVLESKEGLSRMPYLAPVWAKVSGHPYGRGPGVSNFGDIRAVNKLKELGLNRVALNTLGAWSVVDDGVINPYNFNIAPGAVLPVARNARDNPSIQALELPSDLDATYITLEDLRRDIDAGYLANVLPSPGKTPKSATEVIEQSQVVAQEMGATYANLQAQFLIPVVSATIDILIKKGKLLKEHRLDQRNIDITFVSQIALAQRMQEVNTHMQFASYLMQFTQFDPALASLVDMETLMRGLAERMNIDRAALRSTEDVAQAREQAQQQMQQLQAQQAQQAQPQQGGPQQP